MKIVHLNAFDVRGGAAITVSRLHRALRAAGIDSRLLVQFQAGDVAYATGPRTKFAKALALAGDALDPLPMLAYRDRPVAVFSCNWVPSGAARRAAALKPDLIHLHWINAGMLPPRALRHFTVPIVWTLHDMWPFTGGCHQSNDCTGYRTACGACPVLASSRPWDLSRWLLTGKTRAWRGLPIVPVAPSKWLAERARCSSIFRGHEIAVVSHGVDRSVYRPWDRETARRLIGLPDGQLVMFSAAKGLHTPQKGIDAVRRIMSRVRQQLPQVRLLVMGSEAAGGADDEMGIHYLGHLQDDASRAMAFAAADALLSPSEGESFGNVVLESLACGTPVAAYATGAAPELLSEEVSGRAVAIGDEDALGEELLALLRRSPPDRQSVRAVTESHDLADMAAGYIALYRRVLGA